MRGKWSAPGLPSRRHGPFNEARALCAGNGKNSSLKRRGLKAFNEARALCAGNALIVLRY